MWAIRTLVALRKESVDRNPGCRYCHRYIGCVALRKESVDRNVCVVVVIAIVSVALRKESVDRNKMEPYIITIGMGSLSARRAWIEICARLCTYMHRYRRSPQGERG